MNLYIIVEGSKTEMNVYPAWLALLAPQLKRIDDAWDLKDNNYYMFSGGGIPSIYDHIAHAVEDINNINAGDARYDCLMVCMDTENVDREKIEERINERLHQSKIMLKDAQLLIFEQKVCMETWFLGNRHIFKDNPQSEAYRKCIQFYNVSTEDPELMETDDEELNKAQYHYKYLMEMFRECHMIYSKNNTKEVEREGYLNQLILRFKETGHLGSFGKWYGFVTSIK